MLEAFSIISDMIGIEIGSDAIVGVPRLSGAHDLNSSGVEKIFINFWGNMRFAFADFRTLIIQRSSALHARKAFNVGFTVESIEAIRIFENLLRDQ